MPRTDTLTRNRPGALRNSPVSIAIATFVAIVSICTALFFAIARLVYDADRHFTGAAFSSLGAWALVFIMLIFVLPLSLLVLVGCIDRCPSWWSGILTLFISILATLACIAFPASRRLLPISLLTKGTDSSDRWYFGAIVQLLIALCLLRYFRKPKTSHN